MSRSTGRHAASAVIRRGAGALALLVAAAAAANAQPASSVCVEQAATIRSSGSGSASLFDTLWVSVTDAFASGRTRDRRVVREFRVVLLETLTAKQLLSSRLESFAANPTDARWKRVRDGLRSTLEQLGDLSRDLENSVRGTALADTEVFSALKLEVDAKRQISLCAFQLEMPSAEDRPALAASHRTLDEHIAVLRALDAKIVAFLQAP